MEWPHHQANRPLPSPQLHEEIIFLKGVELPLRQIAVKNIGHEEPTLIITNDFSTADKDLFARYAERMIIENELDADIAGIHLDALSSGLLINVDLDTTLTVAAGNCYRLFVRTLPRYEFATPDPLWRCPRTGKLSHRVRVNVKFAINPYARGECHPPWCQDQLPPRRVTTPCCLRRDG